MNFDNSGGAFTPEETAYFESGGETELPADTGSDLAGGEGGGDDVTNMGGEGDGSGGNKPEGGKQPNDKDKSNSTVPYSALHEERQKRKQLGGEVDQLKGQLSEMGGKLAVLLGLQKKPEGEGDKPAGPPKPEDDIFGAVNDTNSRLAKLEKAREDDAAAAKEDGERATFVSNYRADADAFTKDNADYKDAYNFLLNTRAVELIAIGYDDPAELKKNGADLETVQAAAKALHDALVADEFAIAQMAAGKKKSAASIIYNLAKQRGYKKADAKPGEGEGKGAAQLETIERGLNSNKSLNGAGGGADGDEMTAQRLINMSLSEFEKYAEANPDKVRELMGG
jgi:hypothetical protein